MKSLDVFAAVLFAVGCSYQEVYQTKPVARVANPDSLLTDEVMSKEGNTDIQHAKLRNNYLVTCLNLNKYLISSPPLQDGNWVQIYLEGDERLQTLTVLEGPAIFEIVCRGVYASKIEPTNTLDYKRSGEMYSKHITQVVPPRQGIIATEHATLPARDLELLRIFERLYIDLNERFAQLIRID